MEVIVHKLVSDYKEKHNDFKKYDLISNWIVEQMTNMSLEKIDSIFDMYSLSIYHINLFNYYYPCLYILDYKNMYVHLVLYSLFIQYVDKMKKD